MSVEDPKPNIFFILVVLVTLAIAIPSAWVIAQWLVGTMGFGRSTAKVAIIPVVAIGGTVFKVLEKICHAMGLSLTS